MGTSSAQPDQREQDRPLAGRSLSFRFVVTIVVLELIFGVLLGLIVSGFSLRLAAEDRRASLAYVTSVVAASIMPVVADQDPAGLAAQLESIVGLPEGYEIECVRVNDTAGRVLAESSPRCTCDEAAAGSGMLGLFTEPQVVEQPIDIDGLPIAVVSVQFRPVGLDEALWEPLRATLIVVGIVLILTTLWGTWFTLRTVVEPIESLRDGAERIAEGDRDLELWSERSDEIGQLARSLDDMMHQLETQEGELLDSYDTLEQALRAQERLGQELQQTIRVRSDFVAVASHELRSPLAVIQLYGEMMATGEFGELDERAQDAVRSIVSAATRLGSIMANLMDVALLERGLMPLEFSDVRLDTVAAEAVADASGMASRRGTNVELAGDAPEASVQGDANRLRQVIDNVLSNAIRYAPVGSAVEVEIVAGDESASVRVRDRGSGIPADRAHVLFEPFGRVETGDAADPAGLGLGLAISARIAEAHGGSLHAEAAREGPGTVFVLSVPYDTAVRPAAVRVVPDD